MASGLISIQPG